MGLLDLPFELLVSIFEYLPSEDLILYVNVCQKFRQVITLYPARGSLNLSRAHELPYRQFIALFGEDGFPASAGLFKILMNEVRWFSAAKDLLPQCRNLTTLQISELDVDSEHLINIFSSCRKLEEIDFKMPKSMNDEETMTRFQNAVGSLPNMKIISFTDQHESPYLKLIKLTPNLRSLKIRNVFDVNEVLPRVQLRVINPEIVYGDLDENRLYELREFEIVRMSRKLFNYSVLDRIAFSENLTCPSHKIYLTVISSYYGEYLIDAEDDLVWLSKCEKFHYIVNNAMWRVLNNLEGFPMMREVLFTGRCGAGNFTDILIKMPRLNSLHFYSTTRFPLSLNKLKNAGINLQKLSYRCFSRTHSTQLIRDIKLFPDLTVLSIPPCFLDVRSSYAKDPMPTSVFGEMPTPAQKQSMEIPENGAVYEALENCRLIKVLEIADFSETGMNNLCNHDSTYWIAIYGISLLKDLTYLTLQSIPLPSGEVFKIIGKSCQRLETLRISHVSNRRDACTYVSGFLEALSCFENLHTLRIKEKFLLRKEIFNALLCNCPNLKRIGMFTKGNREGFDEASFKTLVTTKRLNFGYFHFEELPQTTTVRLNEELQSKVKSHVYIRVEGEGVQNTASDVPLKDYREVVRFTPWITMQ